MRPCCRIPGDPEQTNRRAEFLAYRTLIGAMESLAETPIRSPRIWEMRTRVQRAKAVWWDALRALDAVAAIQ